jgi:undecaprenyl pyrophosphate synthase
MRTGTKSRWLPVGLLHRLAQSRQLRGGRPLQNPAFGIRSLRHSESQFPADQRRHAIKEKVIQARTRLPANLNDVFESRRRNQRDASAFALQQSVGPDGRAVQQRERRFARSCRRSRDL